MLIFTFFYLYSFPGDITFCSKSLLYSKSDALSTEERFEQMKNDDKKVYIAMNSYYTILFFILLTDGYYFCYDNQLINWIHSIRHRYNLVFHYIDQ